MAAEFPLVLIILGIFVAPFIIFSLIWTLFGLAYPFMFIWGMLTSGSKLDNMIQDTVNRERGTREVLGRDPLTTVDGGFRSDVSEAG
ncbi:MAG: hypothetical protein CMB46_03325, partial [Euryarchaeota archaeon]|nr:hypothetical protein [Euryarchaeota archaeon]